MKLSLIVLASLSRDNDLNNEFYVGHRFISMYGNTSKGFRDIEQTIFFVQIVGGVTVLVFCISSGHV